MSHKQIPVFERFVPEEVKELLDKAQLENGWTDKKPFIALLQISHPEVPYSTITRWVRAFVAGVAHSDTPSWHKQYRTTSSLISPMFSALRDGRYKEERKKWGDEIRYVNWSCWHRPVGDGALITLALQLASDFKPNVVPVMSDFLHMNQFSPHRAKPHTYGTEILDENIYKPNRNRYKELDNLTTECIDMVRSAVGDEATLLNLWGNHENWIMRHLLELAIVKGDLDLVEKISDDYFTLLQNLGVLWVEMDARRYLPLTEHFWIGHGHLTGKNVAAKYHNKLKSAVSLAVGHVHEGDEMWVKTPRDEHFVAVAPTLGVLTDDYNNRDFVGHTWGVQFITHPTEGWVGAAVENVKIQYERGYYVAKFRGKSYSEKAVFDYDELLDIIEIGSA